MSGFYEGLIPPLITSATIVAVAWWVNTTIRKRQQGGPLIVGCLEHVQRVVNRTMDDLFAAGSLEECTALLKALSNEAAHLQALHEDLVGKEVNNELLSKMKLSVFELKEALTGEGVPPAGAERAVAAQSAATVRRRFLEVSLAILRAQ